jgi:hypothetical protein
VQGASACAKHGGVLLGGSDSLREVEGMTFITMYSSLGDDWLRGDEEED